MTSSRLQALDAALPEMSSADNLNVASIAPGTVPRDLPDYLAKILNEAAVPNCRSDQTYALVLAAAEFGCDDQAIVAMGLRHAPTTEKYAGRADREIARAVAKARGDHPHPGRSCTEADCPNAPGWMVTQAADWAARHRERGLSQREHRGQDLIPKPGGDSSLGRDERSIRIEDAEVGDLADENSVPVIPAEFWAARPVFEHIRQAARARMVAPDALLGADLARVCVHTDHRLVLPAVVGRTGSLNVTVAVVGPSGAGKGSVSDESRDLLGDVDQGGEHVTGEAPAGSGEGMVAVYFDSRPDPEDKRRRILVQARHGMLVRVDEGETLRHLAARTGQTTLQVLRQAFSGEALGGSYADESRRYRLAAHSYRMGVLIAVQPEIAAFLIDDSAGGTPQRFAWFAAVDPAAPEVDELIGHPGAIDWAPPLAPFDPIRAVIGPDRQRRYELGVCTAAVGELRAQHRRILTGTGGDALDAHAGLVRLKIAALLAILDGRLDVDEDDWHLARMVADTSRRVRDWTRNAIDAEARRRDWASNERAAERAGRVENAKAAATAKVARVAAVIGRHVHKHGADDEPCGRRCLTQAVQSSDRDEFDAALGHAVSVGWVIEQDGARYEPGESRPA